MEKPAQHRPDSSSSSSINYKPAHCINNIMRFAMIYFCVICSKRRRPRCSTSDYITAANVSDATATSRCRCLMHETQRNGADEATGHIVARSRYTTTRVPVRNDDDAHAIR